MKANLVKNMQNPTNFWKKIFYCVFSYQYRIFFVFVPEKKKNGTLNLLVYGTITGVKILTEVVIKNDEKTK